MREDGLELAIKAAGGIRSLARRLDVSQPAVSTWKRIPANRVLSIESITGLSRQVLRPDLYPTEKNERLPDIDPIDASRADEYALIAALLWRAPTAEFLSRLSRLKGDASGLGMAHLALGRSADGADPDTVQREFFDLFIGLGRGELLPYASYYRTGFLHERPLADVRGDLARLGIERDGRASEPEDHIAILCEVMAGLIRGEFTAAGLDEKTFFERHIASWASRFFADLAVAKAVSFYRHVGALGSILMAIEAEAFALPD